MEKLFAALQEKHPGYEVRDIKFIMNVDDIDGQKASDVDANMANIVKHAEILEDASTLG
ncbi:hypothetical protein [uncultured Tateyamaria sp.]|uniref:hypothetical protein n=1 Tax=uncultured Tateyamaria sp. TaxID=455651 RepID=UPI0026291EF8|nr:hypothetical protein [uncultured Tateyamaria sp.]